MPDITFVKIIGEKVIIHSVLIVAKNNIISSFFNERIGRETDVLDGCLIIHERISYTRDD